jgi:hypothetical protein
VTDYSILAMRTQGEQDGRLFPAVTAEGAIALEELDGEPLRIAGSALRVREPLPGGWRTPIHVRDAKLQLLITESRVIVASRKQPGRSGWWGWARRSSFSLIANDSDMGDVRRRRRRATLLVGHVRYPWLRCVGFRSKTGWRSDEEVRFGLAVRSEDGSVRELYLHIALPGHFDSAAVARAIIKRVAIYRLRHMEFAEPEHRARMMALSREPERLAPEPTKFVMCSLPEYRFVNAASAYPGPRLDRARRT